MSTTSNFKQGLTEVGLPLEGNYEIIDKYLLHNKIVFSIDQIYSFLEDDDRNRSMNMNIDISYQENDNSDVATDTLFTVSIEPQQLVEYRDYLRQVIRMIDDQITRRKIQ